MQGKHDASEFGFVVCDSFDGSLQSAAANVVSGTDTVQVSTPNDDGGIQSEYFNQLVKIQKERQYKY